ncbi:MAG: hypothetical protein AB8G99_09405 [Planctomycetaceae bacterium]
MKHRRTGISSTEVICSAIIVAVVSATVAPALVFVGKQNRTSSQHLNATAALGNMLDEITASPFDEVTAEAAARFETPDWLAAQLVEPKLVVTVEANEGGKRVSTELTWQSIHGGPREKVVLHAWIFDTGGPA